MKNSGKVWFIRLGTLAVWTLIGLTSVYWALQWVATRAEIVSAPLAGSETAKADPTSFARLLGGGREAAPVQTASIPSRFALVGVIADKNSIGAALIAVDGKSPRPYRVGSPIEEGLVLKSVEKRRAVLAASRDAPPAFTLTMPALPTSRQ